MIYNEAKFGVIPENVALVLKALKADEKEIKKNQRLLGERVHFNEKSIGCTSQLQTLSDQYGSKNQKVEIEVDCLIFSKATISGKEPIRFQIAKSEN